MERKMYLFCMGVRSSEVAQSVRERRLRITDLGLQVQVLRLLCLRAKDCTSNTCLEIEGQERTLHFQEWKQAEETVTEASGCVVHNPF